ncbi:MAG TPA: nicotinamide riboside transporter PnuC [Pyrinomonadaceae bacterium]|nr:nicotinamide riboside transporter PnuC [Pyrinomonadaceae bacterium]
MFKLLDVNNVAFTLLGYPMSYVELFGTLLYLSSVWLMARRRMLTWPVGIVSVLLYAALFYQIRLYSDALEQVYYLAASAYGWWNWSKSRPADDKSLVGVRYSSPRGIVWWLIATLALAAALGAFMGRAHVLLPTLFPEPASYPFLDALTTVMSFTAMWLLARRRIESWLYWIVVDVIGIWLYYVKGVKFVALLYVLLLGLAVNGLISWTKSRDEG